MKSGPGRVALWLCFLLIILMLLGPGISVFLPAVFLIIGWIPSSWRLIHASSLNPGTMIALALAATVLLVGSHRFLRWLHRNLSQQNPEPAEAPGLAAQNGWRWRWTVCLFGIGFASLVSVGCGILTIHQVFWLSRSSEPWLVNVTRNRVFALKAAYELREKAEACGWSTSETQKAFWRTQRHSDQPPVWEAIRPVWAEGDPGTLRAVVLIPRTLPLRGTARFAILQPGTNVETFEMESLPETLAAFGLGNRYAERPRTP